VNLHYAETLREWRRRFNKNIPRVIQLGFDDAFIRYTTVSVIVATFKRMQVLELLPVLLRSRVRGSDYEHSDPHLLQTQQSEPGV
jgi:cyclopropane fatty-acyl-phospholipid synthase-like methyltransferase